MEPIGPKIAEGRDSEIFDHGAGRVLRSTFDGRSLIGEAEVMGYARSHGYPVPEVFEAGDGYLVMERLEGPTMMDWVGTPPFPLRKGGRMLADLHEQLHQMAAPDGMRMAPMTGDRLVHLDLHPMNVIITAHGPVVIDWSNASAGDPAFDVADSWVILAAASAPTVGLDRVIVPIGRRIMLRSFLRGVDCSRARAAIPAAVAHRLTDANLSPDEHRRMGDFARRNST